ncbi:hypothetical protein AR457_06635 [Streptomyces agglomeratus]|uniref:Uncharacterized protein n=1 Tax=Streptomyces agglomeratus TaxID=285458 RepID=A0A1E5PI70_9ACTN|nr:hypothetical protein [Streptomyces agglomeratus]OEJ29258.1 hypothetical protein AS594_06560 [Streptomyces agglomeratus]OEJ42729.1 hypothetical protein BGK70_30010 [Streptomyces agglomeratus]OEJ48757.1 hypothetical protein AR457_06635 [Streptomyces agglomeratus]OEJ56043.1 hypothetical protein BGK72_29330 [Streptomyces agglomeratus]OEJ63433.1 hypothetical protein BGM19_30235 [Streptomyces agglomeratus]
MLRRISTIAVTAAMTGGVLLTALPAHAATTAGVHTMAARGGGITVNIEELRKQSADLKAKAAQLDRMGEPAAAKRARAQAAAIDRRIKQLIDAENNV